MVLSMVLSPLILNNNKRVARFLLAEHAPQPTASEREEAATREIAQRDHVILCGFGRVGQNVARVLESQGFEYIALDLDPARIRAARQAGDPVMFGDSSDEELLAKAGLETRERRGHQLLRSRHLARHPAQRAPRARARCRCWCAPQDDAPLKGAAGRGRDRGRARNVRGEPHAGLARADAAARAGDARGAHARRDPQQPLRGAAQYRAPRRRRARSTRRSEHSRGDQVRGGPARGLGRSAARSPRCAVTASR